MRVHILMGEPDEDDMGKSMRPGGGGRFEALKEALSHKKGISDPGALAATIGRKKYGAKQMSSWSAAGRKRA